MKKGKLLESVVAIIYSALKTDPSVEIRLNQKLPDLLGNEREIDVLLTSFVNTILIQIAIECKDHSSRISVDKIEGFKGKCEFIPNINKLIFVSKSGFQKAAITKAKAYGIDLFRLEEINELSVIDWFSIFRVQPMRISRKITQLIIDFDSNPIDDYLPTDIVVIENGQ
ncbi:MAG TPA: restriction endonuclease [Saprospiraceae bacterium]|nr:restriction endonuclease [Saprospiraceae bacterium]